MSKYTVPIDKLTEGRNTGISKIKRALKNNGSPEPIFETDDNRTYFITTILIHEGFKTPQEIPQENFNKIQLDIIKMIKQNPSITQKEMAVCYDLTIEQIKYNIKLLKEKKVISRIGSTKKGKWVIYEK